MSLQLQRTSFGNSANKGNVLSRDEANSLLQTWVPNPRLQLHMKQVAALMKSWAAEKLALDEAGQWRWEMAGLLHDADWEQWPELHCSKIIEELETRQVDPEIIHAIASHGHNHFGVEPVSEMDKMLYAFDELSGFLHAYSLMRPEGYGGMAIKGVKKRLKDKAFAAGVNRHEVADALERAGISLEEILEFMIERQALVE